MATIVEVRELVEAGLSRLGPDLRARVEQLLVEPYVVDRQWSYGAGKYPCWTVLEHTRSGTGIAYCDFGFGPERPWGLVWLQGDGVNTDRMGIGQDSAWFSSLEEAFIDSFASNSGS